MSNVDPEEIARFDAVAARWWDPDGEMRPLHDLNPVRLAYIERAGSLQGSEVLVVSTQHGRAKGSGIEVETRYAVLYEIRGDKIIRMVLYSGLAEALEAAGLRE